MDVNMAIRIVGVAGKSKDRTHVSWHQCDPEDEIRIPSCGGGLAGK